MKICIFLLACMFLPVSLLIAQEKTSKINWFVGNTEPGEWIEYKEVWLTEGHYRFTAQVLAEREEQTIQIEINGMPVQSNVEVNRTDTFTLVHLGSKQLPEGYYNLRLVFNTGHVNCDMFFVKKDASTASGVLTTDTEYSASPLNDGMMIAPIGDQSFASANLVVNGDRNMNGELRDKNGKYFSQEQILAYYRQQSYTYTPRNSDQSMDMWVAELVAAKPDFVFMHGRSAADFTDDLEDRDYNYGDGALSGDLLKRFVEAVNRSPYAKGNIRVAYFQDNAGFGNVYQSVSGKAMTSWDDPNFMQVTWERWFKPWYDAIPSNMLYQPEPGKVPVQLWTPNISGYSGTTYKYKEFFDFISSKMKETYGLEPLWVLGSDFINKDPRLSTMVYGTQAWFIWSGPCTAMNSVNGVNFSFAVNGKRLPIGNVWYTDWNPVTNTGTHNGSTDYYTSALLPGGTPLIRNHYASSRNANARWMVLESWSDWQEGTVWYRSDCKESSFPNQHIALVREYADRSTSSLVFEAEACDNFHDSSFRNSGGEYRYHWHTVGEPDLDIYRPLHMIEKTVMTNPGSKIKALSVGYQDLWATDSLNVVKSCEVDGKPFSWASLSRPLAVNDLANGRNYAWAIGTDGKTYVSGLSQGQSHNNINNWVDVTNGKNMKDIDINLTMVVGIDAQGSVFTRDLDGKNPWASKSGATLKTITADDAFIWGFSKDDYLLFCRAEGSRPWDTIPNPYNVTKIDAGGSEVWGLNEKGELYRTSSSGTSGWQLVDKDISVFGVGWEYAWAIDKEGKAIRYDLYGFDNQFSYNTDIQDNKGSVLHTIPGTIQVEDYNNGDEGDAYHDNDATNLGGKYRLSGGVDIKANAENGYYVAETKNGEWIDYDISKIVAGTYNVNFMVSCASAGKTITISLGGDPLCTLNVPNTGAENTWRIVPLSGIVVPEGSNKTLRIKFNGDGVNLDYLTFYSNQMSSKNLSMPGIIEAEDFDFGGEGNAYHESDPENKGGQYRLSEGVDIETTTDTKGNYNVSSISDGEYLEYTINDFTDGKYSIDFRVASASDSPKSITLFYGDNSLVTINVPNTGGNQTWQTVSVHDVEFSGDGNQILKLKFNGGNFNLNYISVYKRQIPFAVHSIPGTIQVEDYDIGGEGVAYHDENATKEGGNYRPDDMVGIENTQDASGRYNIGWTNNGEWLEYTLKNIIPGKYKVYVRVASWTDNATVSLRLGSQEIGNVVLPNTGGYQAWESVKLPNDVNVAVGPLSSDSILRVTISGGMNINYLTFESATTSVKPVQSTGKIAVYPNPAKEKIVISGISDNFSYKIFDVLGNKVMEGKQQQSNIDIQRLNAGFYILVINDLEQVKFIKKE